MVLIRAYQGLHGAAAGPRWLPALKPVHHGAVLRRGRRYGAPRAAEARPTDPEEALGEYSVREAVFAFRIQTRDPQWTQREIIEFLESIDGADPMVVRDRAYQTLPTLAATFGMLGGSLQRFSDYSGLLALAVGPISRIICCSVRIARTRPGWNLATVGHRTAAPWCCGLPPLFQPRGVYQFHRMMRFFFKVRRSRRLERASQYSCARGRRASPGRCRRRFCAGATAGRGSPGSASRRGEQRDRTNSHTAERRGQRP